MKTYCKKCLRTSEVVDMSHCPFCSDLRQNNLPTNIEKQYPEAYRLARRFHEFYEQSAPAFGYETKKETKEFDPESSNGRLMAWVCYEIVKEEKKELIKKIRNKFLGTSTIGRHTLDVFDDYVSGMDLFDDNF